MSKRKHHGSITIDPKIVWNAQKPHYNGWICGHGAHGKNKYSRKQKHKTNWRNYDESS